ncbi:glycosyltransferase [Flavobacterium sp. CHNK8]|uniref:glycosyltransferase n=1 Tax=Flavobacterium sp. CHNK8 TaxID=2871165 RepID=UPI001C8DFDC0|nr:glycosyltransferase [Flavobacterium sp. CHNK8]QZK89645.1 glycosyltransferase [Flavobacterium sp. CHNK8]
MRIIQLIDTLAAGGAERMAVNYANALNTRIDFSGIICTRQEGPLREHIESKTAYLFLNKKRTLDFKAIWALRQYVAKHNIEVIHAHSTSFFLAFMVKLLRPSLQLIWHDHYGDSEFLPARPTLALRLTLPFFSGIIAVNQKLKNWAETKGFSNNVIYLENFTTPQKLEQSISELNGEVGKRIVSLANLRLQKNHALLLEVAVLVKNSHLDWTFHLVGKDFNDNYSNDLKKNIVALNLEQTVFIYGTRSDVSNVLHQATIGILTSSSEGLPLALLEYGTAGLATVVTNVGENGAVIKDGENGYLVAQNSKIFYEKLLILMQDEVKRTTFGSKLKNTVHTNFSEEHVISRYLSWLEKHNK